MLVLYTANSAKGLVTHLGNGKLCIVFNTNLDDCTSDGLLCHLHCLRFIPDVVRKCSDEESYVIAEDQRFTHFLVPSYTVMDTLAIVAGFHSPHLIFPPMEQVTLAVDKLKGFLKSSEEFAKGVPHKREKSSYCNPIEILKRLQREAFSDIMKLRDRQEKVEKFLSLYKSTQGGPFQEGKTQVHGIVNLAGALLFVDNVDEETCVALSRAGCRTGVDSRFTFETTLREKDVLLAEFEACQNEQARFDDVIGSPLSLTKVMYSANVSDWFSAVASPCGARCRDVAITSNSLQQEQSLANFSSFRPPLLGQSPGAAVALVARKSNIAAVLAEFVSGVEMQPDSVGIRSCFSTFGQVIYQLSQGTNLTLFGLHRRLNAPSQRTNLPKFAIPVGTFRRREVLDGSVDTPASPITGNADNKVMVDGSVALMLESDINESMRIGGWVGMQSSSPRCLQWAVTVSDTPENELGWGLSWGGMRQDSNWDHSQVEAFLKFNVGKRFCLQPGLAYFMDGTGHIPALMLRSSCTL